MIVRVLGARRDAKDLRQSTKYIDRGLQKHRHLIRYLTTLRCRAGERVVVARTGVVDELLETSRVCHCGCEDGEANRYASYGAEADAATGEGWVEEFLDDGSEDDAGDGVEGFDGVVGDAVVDHFARLGDEVVEGLV